MFVMAIFRQIQLFVFAFSVAVSAMIALGVLSGRIDRTELYATVAERMATYMIENPDQMSHVQMIHDRVMAVLLGGTTMRQPSDLVETGGEQPGGDFQNPSAEQMQDNPPRSSLEALKLRQRQHLERGG